MVRVFEGEGFEVDETVPVVETVQEVEEVPQETKPYQVELMKYFVNDLIKNAAARFTVEEPQLRFSGDEIYRHLKIDDSLSLVLAPMASGDYLKLVKDLDPKAHYMLEQSDLAGKLPNWVDVTTSDFEGIPGGRDWWAGDLLARVDLLNSVSLLYFVISEMDTAALFMDQTEELLKVYAPSKTGSQPRHRFSSEQNIFDMITETNPKKVLGFTYGTKLIVNTHRGRIPERFKGPSGFFKYVQDHSGDQLADVMQSVIDFEGLLGNVSQIVGKKGKYSPVLCREHLFKALRKHNPEVTYAPGN